MEGKVLSSATGINGTLELLEDRIRVRRDGWIGPLYGKQHHEEELFLPMVHRVILKKTAGGLAGYLAVNDGTDPDKVEDLCISFLLPQEHKFEELQHAIEAQKVRYMESPEYHNLRVLTVN